MVVVAPGAEAVERRHRIPDEVGVAQAAALLGVQRQAKFIGSLLPELEEAVGARVSGPGGGFGEDLDLDLAGIAIGWAVHLARPGQREQVCFGLREDL